MKKSKLLILACLLLTGCAHEFSANPCWDVQAPPAKYLNKKVTPKIIWLHAEFINNYCRKSGIKAQGSKPFIACEIYNDYGVSLIIPDDVEPSRQECLIVHETAHLDPWPWPADHPTH